MTGSRGVLGDGVLLGIGTLTALPVPPPSRVDGARAAVAMTLAPILALPALAPLVLPAVIAAVVDLPAGSAAVLAVLGLVTAVLATRGLHLDGLADTADGLSCGYDRDRAMEVMRRSDIGPSGVVATVSVLGVQGLCLVVLTLAGAWPLVLAAAVSSRASLVELTARGVPPARSGGLGAAVAGSVARPIAVLALALGLVLMSMVASWPGALTWGAGIACATALLVRCTRRFGGITGDVLGAGVEVALTGALVAAALLLPLV